MRIPRRSDLPRFAAAILVVASACSDHTIPTDVTSAPAPAARPSFSISDARSGGREGIYFLPPLVASPGTFTGTFDPGVAVSARVCTPVPACGTTVASWSTGAGITVDATRQWYAATWAAPASLTLGSDTYRLELLGGGGTVRLAYIDYHVVNSTNDLRTVPAGYAGLVRGANNAIRFRLENGAPLTVTVNPPSASVTVGGTQVFTATVTNLHGNPIPSPAITWSSSNTGVATVSPTSGSATTATGVAAGSADIVAAFANVTGQGSLTVSATSAPAASNDTYQANAGSSITVPAGTGLLANDALGTPAATVASYGGGSLGGAVTDHAAGSTTTFGSGGSLTVNADGSLAFTPTAGFTGAFTFQYRLTNAGGSSDATVTITVVQAPTAVNDTYQASVGATLTIPTGTGLLANDTRGAPAADVASYGGGSLGGAVTDHAAGSTTTFGTGGSLTVNADGSVSFTPATGFTGAFTFQYRLTNAVGSSDATVTINVTQGPTAVNDAYQANAGSSITVPVGIGLLANDTRGAPAADVASYGGGSLGGAVTDHAAGSTTTFGSGGSLTVNADGSLTFTPAAGFTGDFIFQYRITNAVGSSTATVTIGVVRAPTAVNDTYTAPLSGALTVATPGVLANDDRGVPLGTVASFGGGDLGGTVTTNAAGASVSDGHGGTIQLDATGALTYTPSGSFAGQITFSYRLTNSAGSSDATVTITVPKAPAAVADAYTASLAGALSVPAAGVLTNDDLGSPTATLVSYGGGALGGAVTDHAAGSTTTFGSGGSLTVNANGSITFQASAGFSGTFTFQYRLANAFANSDATVTITVPKAPDAVNDGPPSNTSVPGNAFHTTLNTTLAIPSGSTTNLLANDDRGSPQGSITSFGEIVVGALPAMGTVTTNAAGATVSLPDGGSLTVNADGTGSFTPGTNFTGLVTFKYRLANAHGSDDATVTIAVGQRPSAANDTYTPTLLGNVGINTATSSNFKLHTNDQGDRLTFSVVGGSATHGTASVQSDGTFTFAPERGYTGAASFQYQIANGFGTSTATVSLNISGMVWFINAAAAVDGDGTFASPYKLLASFHAKNALSGGLDPDNGDNIFVYTGSYVAPLALRTDQKLVGQGATGGSLSALLGVTWPADAPTEPSIGGTRPTITSTGSGITLGSNNTIRGLNLGDVSGGTALIGNGFGTLTIAQVGINTTKQALALTNGTLAGSFSQVQSTGGTNNVVLTNVATTATTDLGTSADALSGATGNALTIDGGNGSFTYAGAINNGAARTVRIVSKTGGTVTIAGSLNPVNPGGGIEVSSNSTGTNTISFTGAAQRITTSGGTNAVDLNTNTGATIEFTGGALTVVSGSGDAFRAIGGGNVRVTGAGNTLASTGGAALRVTSTTIASSGLTFKSIAATGGTNGILLSSTGTTNGLTVTGDGASDPANTTRGRTTAKQGGGTLALGSGGTISGTSGAGVSLANTGPVTLRNMTVQNGSNDGVAATSVIGLTLDNVSITGQAAGHGLHTTSVNGMTIVHTDIGNNATSSATAASDIWNVRIDNQLGTGTVSHSKFHDGYEHIFQLKNTSGTTTLNVNNVEVNGAQHGDGLDIYAYGSSNVTASVTGSFIHDNSSFGFDSGTENTLSATLNVTVSGNQFTNNFVGVDVAHGSSGTNTFLIENNNIQANVASSSQAINVNRLGHPSFTGFGLFSGKVNGNTIGTAGVANSGSNAGDGITVSTNGNGGETRVTITNNVIRQYAQHGIGISAVDATTGHTLQARVQGNNIANGKPVLSLDGINVGMGALNTDHITMCLDIGGAGAAANTVTSPVRSGVRVRASGLPAAVITLTMPAFTTPADAYLAGRNTITTPGGAATSFSNANGTTNAGNCTTPP